MSSLKFRMRRGRRWWRSRLRRCLNWAWRRRARKSNQGGLSWGNWTVIMGHSLAASGLIPGSISVPFVTPIVVVTIWWPWGVVVVARIVILRRFSAIVTALVMTPVVSRIISGVRVIVVTVTRVARIRTRIRSSIAATRK